MAVRSDKYTVLEVIDGRQILKRTPVPDIPGRMKMEIVLCWWHDEYVVWCHLLAEAAMDSFCYGNYCGGNLSIAEAIFKSKCSIWISNSVRAVSMSATR